MITEAQSLFVSETIRTARALPISESLTFLQGCISCLNPDHEVTETVRKALDVFIVSDRQLELILEDAGK